jgi:hypothetical protein
MKALIACITLLLVLPAIGLGQSTLNFGYVIGADELSRAAIAVVNPQAASAQTTFTLYGSAGEILQTANLTIPAGGQLSKLANQLFPTAGTGGWIQATSAAAGLRGFWLLGDFATFEDGAEAAAPASEMVLPLITDQSDISLLNPGSEDAAILIRLYTATGQELAEPAVRVLPPKGSFRGRATALFSPLDWSAATHAKIISGTPVVASAAISNFQMSPSLSALNAVSTVTPPTEFIFPHVVQGTLGADNYMTIIGVSNATATSQTVTLTFFPSDGSLPISIQRILAGNGALRMRASSLFQFSSALQSGWVRVSAPLGIAGFASNADLQQGGVSATAGLSRPQASFIFGHIADLAPWWTGVALVNPGQSSATVEIFAIAQDGTLIGGADNSATARFVIPPGGRVSQLLKEFIPQTQSRSVDGGFVFVRSNVPLYGLGLFFTRDLRILSIVPGLDVTAGVTFVPPSPAR